jgi:hypothetical protein
MTPLFADENVGFRLVQILRVLGYDVLTAFEAGRANMSIADAEVLAHAIGLGRAVLTNNRRHFHHLHKVSPVHAGIVTYTRDADVAALAQRIHTAASANEPLTGKLIKVIRPP